METTFTPISALLGGMLIGLAASLLLLLNGRIAGISGMFHGGLRKRAQSWQWLFLLGLLDLSLTPLHKSLCQTGISPANTITGRSTGRIWHAAGQWLYQRPRDLRTQQTIIAINVRNAYFHGWRFPYYLAGSAFF